MVFGFVFIVYEKNSTMPDGNFKDLKDCSPKTLFSININFLSDGVLKAAYQCRLMFFKKI